MAENIYEKDLVKMRQITDQHVRELISVWRSTFDNAMCSENLKKLYEHTDNYYKDLVSESLEKKSYIESEISKLRKEADELRRLLKTDVNLPQMADSTDIPLIIIQNEMDESLTELRKQLRQRHEQINYLLLEQGILCEELGEDPRPLLSDPLPTATDIDEFRYHLSSLKNKRDERMQQLIILRREIKNYLQILDIHINTEADNILLNQRQIKLSSETFDNLLKMRQRYCRDFEELKMNIDTMRQKLSVLWERLNIPYEERRKVERYTEYNQLTLEILYQELERCEEMKRINIKCYILKIRIEIEVWWDKTLKSEVERSRFSNFNSQDYTDELLTLHEMELDDLKRYYENYQQIFDLYENRKILWERMTAIEQKGCDPARYNNRGGQLLREEKERKIIATKLPKIEQQIRELVQDYEEREHEPFRVFGENILEIMESEWLKKRQDKEAISTARKNAITPQKNRSQYISASRTPLSQRNASSILRKTPFAINLSSARHTNLAVSAQKRKLNPREKTTPIAKKSLFISPRGDIIKPPMKLVSASKTCSKENNTSQSRIKKPPRVIATTIRRYSGRLSASGAIKKRRSIPKTKQKNTQITVNTDTDDDNYDSFKNRIEPDSRSSIQVESSYNHKPSSGHNSPKTRRLVKLTAINENNDDKIRLQTLPRPQIVRTPSKQNLRDFPLSPGMGSSCSSNRKLTTKNLPIII